MQREEMSAASFQFEIADTNAVRYSGTHPRAGMTTTSVPVSKLFDRSGRKVKDASRCDVHLEQVCGWWSEHVRVK